MKVGVLALQGDVREHVRTLSGAGATPVEVRTPDDFEAVDGLVIPGGESTTMGKLAVSAGLVAPVRERAEAGMPILGTCAGMIVLATEVLDGDSLFGLLDLTVRRNAYGRQVESFEADLEVRGIAHPVRGVFIRAPWVERVGAGVEVLAEHEARPVVLEQANLVVASFHPELVGETGLHAYWLGKV
jgi:5'-phosphate synthase pdxT subunit